MDGKYLVTSSVTSPVQSVTKPTLTTAPVDKTPRTVELEKGMTQPVFTRQTTPSINLGGGM